MKSEEFRTSTLKSIGNEVFISKHVEIRRPHLVSVGSFCAIDSGFYLTTSAQIGNFVHIGPYVTCIGGANAQFVMHDFSTLAAGVRIICLGDEHLGFGMVGPTIPKVFKDRSVGGIVTIERFASVGTNAVIMPGLTLGEGSVVGAGAIVTKNTEPWTIYVGNPAKPFKIRPREKIMEFADEITRVYL